MQKVKLVSKSSFLLKECNSVQDFISYCARVSNPENQENYSTAEKLLKYCINNRHWSIFEMVSFTFEIETTRDIGRQILRHKSFSFQEFSQRYADPTKSLNFVTRETRLQDTKNRQNSLQTEDRELKETWNKIQDRMISISNDYYNWAIQHGIAKEQARAILPEGLTLSRMYMAGTLRSFIHYCMLRMGEGTQKEHREIAKMIWEELLKEIPSLAEISL